MHEMLVARAGVLIEALPYIKKFAGKTFVIKYGGQAMVTQALKESVVIDIILMKYIGINPIIVHGGGAEVTHLMERLGMEARFVNGLRVTDKETMELVEMVLVGKVNKEIVTLFNGQGGKAVGLCGKDANLFSGRKYAPVPVKNGEGQEMADLGFVGDITQVNPDLVHLLCQEGYIPIISSVGATEEGESLNINADHAAGHLAAALKAEKLILLTDVEGIFLDPHNPGTLISALSQAEAKRLMASGEINKGMIPKVEACLRALEGGVNRTHIINGCMEHSLLLEILTHRGIGTMVTGEEDQA